MEKKIGKKLTDVFPEIYAGIFVSQKSIITGNYGDIFCKINLDSHKESENLVVIF